MAYYEDLLSDNKEATILYDDLMRELRKSYTPSLGSNLTLIGQYLNQGGSSNTTLGKIRTPFKDNNPTTYTFTSAFGPRTRSSGYQFHEGVDIVHNLSRSGEVASIAEGKVIFSSFINDGITCITISHPILPCTGKPGYTSYLHCSDLKVSKGQNVKEGQVIAYQSDKGSPGAVHLHFSVHDEQGWPLDPAPLLDMTESNLNEEKRLRTFHMKNLKAQGVWESALARKNNNIYGTKG